jgi:diguanylate cyclase (GGDEF)-like protein/PAS domain S-box-containing protein
LADIVSDFLDLLDTSVAVYEQNGDYALGIFASRWCQLLDRTSRQLCNTEDNCEALSSGRWLCHESCWDMAREAMEKGEAVDRECIGGIRIYAVPIRASGEVIGSINAGYGDPPQDLNTLYELAEKYQVGVEDLKRQAARYESRPHFIIELAKKRIRAGARLIGEIVQRRQTEQELVYQQKLLETIINGTWDILSIKRPDFTVERYNQAGYDMLGRRPEEVHGRRCFELIGRGYKCSPCATQMALEQKKSVNIERYIPEVNMHLDCRSSPVVDGNGKVVRIVEHLRDISQRKYIEKSLLRKTEEQAMLLDSIPTQVWYLWDAETYGAVNQAHADFIGLSKEIIGFQRIDRVLSRDEAEVCKKGNLKVYASKRQLQSEEWMHNAQGEQRLLAIMKTPKLNDAGEVEYVVCSGTDITEQRQYESELRYLSFHDQLTGLFNRAYLENELERLSKSREFPVSIICMDLDGLKLINDTMGHGFGDRQLKDCANILQNSFRSSDIVARVGGDEFTALLPRTDIESGAKIVHRIQDMLDVHNQDQNRQFPLHLSIGLACAEKRSDDLTKIYKQADDLMYRDKLNRDVNSRSQIMKTLMAALEERDFITSGHALRLEDLCLQLGQKVHLSPHQLSDLNLLAQVHDLGKVGIPDSILFKPGPLTAEEWEIMRQHPEKGYRIAQTSTDLAGIADLILKHHEHWDGTGYPLGLSGEEIPIECRILAIVDSFDAMTNDRPYRKAMPAEEALAELEKYAGTQFDPQLVGVFLEMISSQGK